MKLFLNCAQRSEPGTGPAAKSDTLALHQFPHLTICLAADGMGGEPIASEVSRFAVHQLTQKLCCQLAPWENRDQAAKIIRRVVAQTNDQVIAWISEKRERRNAGTTIVITVWRGDEHLFYTNFGDSRAYLIRDHHISQMSTDHTIAASLFELDPLEVPEQELRRLLLWKYLGTAEVRSGGNPGIHSLQLHDRILLCTDGISDCLNDEQILDVVLQPGNAQQRVDTLVNLAKENGSEDDVSAILLDVETDLDSAGIDADPERSFLFNRNWLTWNDGCLPKMANAIVDEKRFDDLPILADALEEAGCTYVDLLAHLREVDEHDSDCWALQTLLMPALA